MSYKFHSTFNFEIRRLSHILLLSIECHGKRYTTIRTCGLLSFPDLYLGFTGDVEFIQLDICDILD